MATFRQTRIAIAAALLGAFFAVFPAASAALPAIEPENCPAPAEATTLAAGPDGNIWFTATGTTKIGRVTPSCEVTEYSPGLSSAAYGIAKGSDGNVWFTEPTAKKIGNVDPSEPTTSLTEFSVANMLSASYITAGPDGNIWFTLGTAGIGRITPSGVVTEFPIPGANVCSITAGGPDGSVWFGNCASPRSVGRITPKETVETLEVKGSLTIQPDSIAVGADGRLYFPASPPEERIGAITTFGQVVYLKTPPNFRPTSLATGPEGNVWAMERNTSNERQKVTVKALGGTFKLTKNLGEETAPISLDSDPMVIQSALETLPGLGSNVKVTRTDLSDGIELTLEFVGKLARTDVAQVGCNGSGLTGAKPTCTGETIANAVPSRLIRIASIGTLTEFPLKPSTVLPTTKANVLVAGPSAALWYATAGDAATGTPPVIDRFPDDPPHSQPLKVIVIGPGKVVGPGIDCPPFCSADPTEGTKVTLTAIPNPSAFFVVWKGCDTGGIDGVQCTVTADKEKSVTATFVAAPELTVSKAPGSGLGKVTSYPGGILCLANCSTTTAGFKEGAKVKLNQAPSKHFHFVEWLGDCTGSGLCEVTMGEEHGVEALFGEDPKYSLSLTKKGGGQGTVKSSPAGLNCGIACGSQAADFYEGTAVVLTATVQAGKGSTFAGWFGAGCSGTGICTVPMDEAKSVAAIFE